MFENICNLLIPLCMQLASPLQAPALQAFNIQPNGITISGVSSGAFMAVQMNVAYSQTFAGVASVAGGVYWCAEHDADKAAENCMKNPAAINTSVMISKARELQSQNQIDSLANLQKQKVLIYASPADEVVKVDAGHKLLEFYREFTPLSQIELLNTPEAAHGFPTLDKGNPCNKGRLPWLLNCEFDMAGKILHSMYGALQSRGMMEPNHLHRFNQRDFGDSSTPLYRDGWVYVPAACARGASCRLHIALHGCQMNPDFIKQKFVIESGFNEWAETNNIVVLYPQSARDKRGNPYACWDWYGFTGADYVTKSGAQPSALFKMIERLRGL